MSEVVNIGKDSILFDRDMVLNQIDQYENKVDERNLKGIAGGSGSSQRRS